MTLSWTNITVRLGDLKPWADNPRLSTKKQAARLLESFDTFGQPQVIVVGPDFEVYDGHQRLSALLTIHGKDYQVDARQSDRELTDEERRKITLYLNGVASGSWDWDALSGWDAQSLIGWGMDADELAVWKRDVTALGLVLQVESEQTEQEEQEEQAEPQVLRVPDAIWGTDNEYGIPLLDLNMQAQALEAPFIGWGTAQRKSKMTGTYHFYVEDYRFENVWRNPLDIANSLCVAVVEPNFSVYDDMPRAVAIWQMYRKRWIARWLQSVGVRIFVDLNISHRHDNLRFIGVPEGWKAYCTRAYADRLDETELEYEQAVKHAGTDGILFVCYGGGKKAEELAQSHGWIWYPDQQTKDA